MLLRPASEITATPIQWLWPGYLAEGALAILDGDPGLGKSLFTLDLAARLSSGRNWPNGAPNSEPASVILLGSEDPEAIVRARLTALGADLLRTFLWPRTGDLGLPQLPADIDTLKQAVIETGAKLI